MRDMFKKMFLFFFIPWDFRRLYWLPRYQAAKVRLFSKTFLLVDAASFLSTYDELFNKEIYKFKSDIPDPYIVDCGANIGLSIIYFKRLYPGARIIAFEPDPKAFRVLETNMGIFRLQDVRLVPKGVWKSQTVLNFFSEGADGGRIVINGDSRDIISIETVRLKEYLGKRVDFLKIDIEGAEAEVLEDCQDALGNVKNIFVEYHSFVGHDQTLDKILRILSKAGFKYCIHHLGSYASKPFWQVDAVSGMDLQLNIYAYRKS